MCGIAFIINYNDKLDIPVETVQYIFKELKKRGTDASGYYFERIDKKEKITRLIKAPFTSEELWNKIHEPNSDKEKEKFYSQYRINGKEKLIMMHARSRTKGSEYDNYNNMPIHSQEYILIHNGIVTNLKDNDFKYKGTVDSEEILAQIHKHGIEKGMEEIYGSIAMVIKPIMKPVIYIYRNTNPLDIIYFVREKLLIGASSASFIPLSEEQCAFSQNVFHPLITVSSPFPHYLYTIDLEQPKITCKVQIKKSKWGDVDA